MKRAKLINSEISYVIAKLGHFDSIVVCDAGLPVPPGVQRIDLAVSEGVPSFMDVVEAVASEMEIQSVEIAKEFEATSSELHMEFTSWLLGVGKEQDRQISVDEVLHEDFKKHTAKSIAVIRTGEFTPYANAIFKSGVVF